MKPHKALARIAVAPAKIAPASFLRLRFALVLALILGSSAGGMAELVLTNFSKANPVKIMPIGDSITDDCEVNGAWRLYLQPLIETNGYPFTFVGRQRSSPVAPSFTKVDHEGYCGSVIAAPGVFAVHNYTTTNAYLLKIVADALAIATNRPDVVMLLIGANDIGRGRNPYYVATNDMPHLLDLIFSNAPNANVILCKITTLQNANISGIMYGTNAPNVPIYNATLQAMVNQRMLQGQNVSLADMFSTVDYNTMFMADHLHPNATGLKAMAGEWLARLREITRGGAVSAVPLVHGGDTWSYLDTGEDPGTNWAQPEFDDSDWGQGLARLGYGDPTVATPVSFGPNPANKYVTTYFRKSFVVPANLAVTNLNLRLARTGGAVVWLNGTELFRVGLPGGPVSFTNLATANVTNYSAQIFTPHNFPAPATLPGTNWLAVETHQSSPANSVLGFDLELDAWGFPVPPPALSMAKAQNQFVVSWPATNANGFVLYSSTNLGPGADWIASPDAVFTNAGQNIVTQSPDASARFFRLQHP
jgi:lysophospholipase L1-like esterase